MAERTLSIIIPARDEASRIDRLFDGLEALNTDGWNVQFVVVDHLSEDGTADEVRRRGGEVVAADGPTVASARNVGVAATQSEWIAFLDADCVPPTEWLQVAAELFDAESKLGAIGARYVAPQQASRLERVWEAEAAHRVSASGYLPTGGMLLRRAAFDAAGGFTESLETGEDADLSHKIQAAGWMLLSDPRLAVTHTGSPTTLGDLLRQQIWHAQGSRLIYRGRLSPVHLFSLTWIPATLFALVIALRWPHPVTLALVCACFLSPPLLIAAKRGLLRLRSPFDAIYLFLASVVYLLGRTLGRLFSVGRWR